MTCVKCSQDSHLSKKLAEVERKKQYLAKRVESSDRERAGSVGVDATTVPIEDTLTSLPGCSLTTLRWGEGHPTLWKPTTTILMASYALGLSAPRRGGLGPKNGKRS